MVEPSWVLLAIILTMYWPLVVALLIFVWRAVKSDSIKELFSSFAGILLAILWTSVLWGIALVMLLAALPALLGLVGFPNGLTVGITYVSLILTVVLGSLGFWRLLQREVL